MIYLTGPNIWLLDFEAGGWSYLRPIVDGLVCLPGVRVQTAALADVPSVPLAEWLAQP